MSNALQVYVVVALTAAAVGVLVFVLSYGIFFNWRKTPEGRALFWVFVALGLLTVNNILGNVLGPTYAGRDWIRVIVGTTVVITIWRLVIRLWKNYGHATPIQISSKKQEKEEAE